MVNTDSRVLYGSEISFFCKKSEEAYCLASAGFADRRLLLRQSTGETKLLGFERSVFCVEAADDSGLLQSPVIFGATVVLRHSFSDLVISVQRSNTAELDRSCCEVVLKEREMCGTSCRIRIMPRYKMQHIGTAIQFGDELLLQLESTDMLLHVSSLGGTASTVLSHLHWMRETSIEINCGTQDATTWMVQQFSQATNKVAGKVPNKTALLVGQVVELRFSELNKLLAFTFGGAMDVPQKRSPSVPGALQLNIPQTDDSTPVTYVTPVTGYNNCSCRWQIEAEDATIGGVVRVKEKFRLRHATTGMYLCGRGQGVYGDAWVVRLQEPTEDEECLQNMLFTIMPVDANIEDPKFYTAVTHGFLCHVSSGLWIHAAPSEEGPDIIARLSPSCLLEDAVCIHALLEEESIIFKRFNSLVEQLVLYTQHFYDTELTPSINSKSTQKVIALATEALVSLIRFCTSATETEEPLEREGLPIPENQKVLFDLNVHILLYHVISCPFAPQGTQPSGTPLSGGWLPLEALLDDKYKSIHMVCRLCYRLLKQMCKGSSAFASKLQFLVDFMQCQEGYKLHVADTLLEIFTEAADMPAETNEKMSKHFVNLLQTKGQSAGYVKFLSKLCVIQGVGIKRNQEIVHEKLLINTAQLLLTLFFDDAHPDILMVGNIPSKKKGVFAPPCAISTFLKEGDPKTVKYFHALFELYAELCRGHSQACQDAIVKLVTRRTISAILVLPSCLPNVTFIKFMAIRIAVEVYLKRELHYTRVKPKDFLSINSKVVRGTHNHGGLSEEPVVFHRFLQTCTMQILRDNLTLVYDDTDTNEMLTMILTMFVIFLKESLLTIEQEREIIQVVLAMADSSTDKPTKSQGPDDFNKNALTEHSRAVFNVKIAIVEVLNAIFQGRVQVTARQILEALTNDLSTDGMDIMKSAATKMYAEDLCPDQVLPIILPLAQTECVCLSEKAVDFIVNLCSFRKRCIELVSGVKELQRPASVREYDVIEVVAAVLSENISSQWDVAQPEAVLNCLNGLNALYDATVTCTPKKHPSKGNNTNQVTRNTPAQSANAKRRWAVITSLLRSSMFAFITQRRLLGNSLGDPDLDEINMIISHWNIVDILAKLVEHHSIISHDDDPLLSSALKVLIHFSSTPSCARSLTKHADIFLAGLKTCHAESCLKILVSVYLAADGLDVPHDIIHRFIEYIGRDEGMDTLIFDSLESMVFRSYPFPANQRAVFRALWDLNKLYDVCHINASMKNRELMRNSRLMKLLMKTCLGNSSLSTTTRRLVPASDILRVLALDPPIPLMILMPYVRFLGVAHFAIDAALPKSEISALQARWTTNEQWWKAVDKLHVVFSRQTSFSALFLREGYLPTIQLYFSSTFSVVTAARSAFVKEHVVRLLKHLSSGLKQARDKALRGSLSTTIQCVCEFTERLRLPTEFLQVLKDDEGSDPLSTTYRLSTTISSQKPEKTLSAIVQGYLDNSDPSPEECEPLIKAIGGRLTQGAFLQKLIHHMGLREFAPGPMIGLMRAMRFDIETKAEESEEAMASAQDRYDSHGLTPVLVKLFDSTADDENLFNEVVALGIAVLEGGNSQVQASLLKYFNENEERFFTRVKEIIADARSHAIQIETTCAIAQRYSLTKDNLTANYKFIVKMFRFLQLMCEGHNLDMQNYITLQHDNIRNENTLREVLTLLNTMTASAYIGETAIAVLVQTFNLLTEVCQGPCRRNQVVLVQNNVCKMIHSVLVGNKFANTGDAERDESLQNLKTCSVTTLLALLEGCCDYYIPSVMLRQVNVPDIVSLIEECEAFDDEEHINLKYNLLILFYQIDSFRHFIDDTEAVQQLQEAIQKFKGFSDMVGKIEIQRESSLEAVFFRIPEISLMLTAETKDTLQWAVDRSTQSTKLSDFVDKSDDLIYEMEHNSHVVSEGQKYIKNTKVVHLLMTAAPWDTTMMCLAFLVNFFLLLAPEYTWTISFLGILQMYITLHLALIDMFLYTPLDIYKKKKEWGRKAEEALPKREMLLVYLTRLPTWYRFSYLLIAICGVFFHPYFLAVHLLSIIPRSTELQNVTKAITDNGKSLLLTAILGMVIAYLFSIVGFLFFQSDFDADGVKEGAEPTCDTLPKCFIQVLAYGIRQGGVHEIMGPVTWSNESFRYRTMFDTTFWIAMIIIFLNILFGIILDTFASLRDERNKKEEDMRTICFICGMEASSLERQGINFSNHCETEHNVWHYLYFMHHLKRKDPNDYTGQESFVCELLSKKDINFFPSGQCLSLKGKLEEKEQAKDETREAVSGHHQLVMDQEMEERLIHTVREAVLGTTRDQNKPTELSLSPFQTKLSPPSRTAQRMMSPRVASFRLRSPKDRNKPPVSPLLKAPLSPFTKEGDELKEKIALLENNQIELMKEIERLRGQAPLSSQSIDLLEVKKLLSECQMVAQSVRQGVQMTREDTREMVSRVSALNGTNGTGALNH